MRKNQVKLMAAGMLVLALMTGCGLNDNTANDNYVNNNNANQNNADNNNANEGSNNIISENIEDFDHKAGAQGSQTDAGTGQTGESGQPQSQPQDAGDIEDELAAYRAEREKGVSTLGNYTMVQAPNEENYHYGVGEYSYISRFDSRELNEALNAADAYIKDTLNLKSEVWSCIDPRMTAIYEDEDKGVASGYDADNIFLCDYQDSRHWTVNKVVIYQASLYICLKEIQCKLDTLKIQSDDKIQTSGEALATEETEKAEAAEAVDYIGTQRPYFRRLGWNLLRMRERMLK